MELLIGAAGRGWSSGGRAVGSYGVDPLCRRAIDQRWGALRRPLSPSFRLEIFWSLSLCGWPPPNLARRLRPARAADLFVLVQLLVGAAGRRWSSGCWQVRGRVGVAGGRSSGQGGSASSSLSEFPAGDFLVFIPLRVAAAESGAAPSTGAGRGFVRFSAIVGRRCGATMELGLLAGTGSRRRCRRAIERPGGLCVVCSLRLSG